MNLIDLYFRVFQVENFEKLIDINSSEINSENERYFVNIAGVFGKLERNDEAINLYERSLDKFPKNEIYFVSIAKIKLKEEEFISNEESINHLRYKIQNEGSDEKIIYNYYNLAVLYEELKNYEESINYYKKVIEMNKLQLPLAYLYNRLANSYHNLNNLCEAILSLELAIEFDPENKTYYQNLTQLQEEFESKINR